MNFLLTTVRSANAPLLLTVTVVAAWLLCVVCEAATTLLTGEFEQSLAILLMGFFSTFAVILYIALFLLIPGSIYIWAVRRAGKKLHDDEWNTPLATTAKCVLAFVYAAAVGLCAVLSGHLFEVDEFESYTSFFSMPVQIFYEWRAVFPYLGSMLIATPFWVFAYKWAKRRQYARLNRQP